MAQNCMQPKYQVGLFVRIFIYKSVGRKKPVICVITFNDTSSTWKFIGGRYNGDQIWKNTSAIAWNIFGRWRKAIITNFHTYDSH